MADRPVAPWSRVAILLSALVVALGVSRYLTGSLIPTTPADALIFQNALLLIVLGSAVIEHKFTKPGDSVVNGLMGIVTLITVFEIADPLGWWLVTGYCGLVFVLASVCTVVSTGPELKGWRKTLASLTYRPAVVLGRARLLYSIVFLYGVFSFYGVRSPNTAMLVVFWGLFLALWPLQIPQLLSSVRPQKVRSDRIGKVVQTDWPNLLRIELSAPDKWDLAGLALYAQTDGLLRPVMPLYSQVQAGAVLGTGLLGPAVEVRTGPLEPGHIYEFPSEENLCRADVLTKITGGVSSDGIVGFVVEDSSVGELRFETWEDAGCHEGRLVWCRVAEETIYYQVTAGHTREETLSGDRHGFQVARASQLGGLNSETGFSKYPWLPPMNTPVFGVGADFGKDLSTRKPEDFTYGVIPGSSLEVCGPFTKEMECHTAILGVTGSGKTELAFDLIRAACAAGIKVICIDITARYENRLADLHASNLSIAPETSAALSDSLFAVETGEYGAGKEKAALKAFATPLRTDIEATLKDFLTSEGEDSRIGIITLEEISNTKATIFITELFLTGLLRFAKDNRDQCPRVLVVVEEAHTVIPEASTMGLGDYDSRGLVGKIAQVALQGRKFGVGLLVIAQRTATVSKTVLTQCNTMITLNTFDETSLGFLKNVFGHVHTEMIADLKPLQAVVFGKGVRAERPVMVQIPFDQRKVELGD